MHNSNENATFILADMKIIAIIEKGSDGKYSVRSDEHLGNNYFGGFGDTVAAAKADFYDSLADSIKEAKAEGVNVPDKIDVSFHYDLPSFFNDFDFINASKFAIYAGINESKMRQYKSGTAYPGERTTRKILDAIHRIGAELGSVSL